MPNAYVKKMHKKTGKSMDWLEDHFKKAEKLAAEEGHKEDYAYIMGIFKKMIGESTEVPPSTNNFQKVLNELKK
jgi:hypothetical protein